MPTQIYNLKETERKRKNLRKNATRAEQILWFKLRNRQLGVKFRRQYSIGKFVVDFCCPKLNLIVEIDGGVHYFSDNKIKDDSERQKYLENLGFKIVRYTNLEVLYNMENVVENIKSCLK